MIPDDLSPPNTSTAPVQPTCFLIADISGYTTYLRSVALEMTSHTETYDGIGDIAGWVYDLERRWENEELRARVKVAAEESILEISLHSDVPPQVAWDFLTPGPRMRWQPWVTKVTVNGKTGGRRGPGSSNHCMHGKAADLEATHESEAPSDR